MRTGGMTKGLLGFIGVFGLYTASEAPPAKAARTPNVILNKVYRQTFRRILALSESVRHC